MLVAAQPSSSSPGRNAKSTGSFYTPPDLVAELVKSALTPVLEERLKPCATRTERERAVLSLRVCDPACGSGHFLLAAARRLGKELACIRTGDDEPAPERVREAIRDVVAHSIYGVDRNPLAVDLCRVALWIESHDPGKPLTFLDHRIRCGDSLIGVFDLDVLTDGIPDAAFTPLTDDDTQTARLLKAQNRNERESGQYRLPWDSAESLTGFADVTFEIDAIADDSPEAIRRKRALFEHRHDDPVRQRQYLACHLWTAAFFQPLRSEESAITTATLADHLSGRRAVPSALEAAVHLADEHRFFHWPLEFPDVFHDRRAHSTGFDVVLGNPPWERVKLQEKEFFAGRHAAIANAPNAAERKRMIQALASEDPAMHRSFRTALRNAEGQSRFLRDSARYPLCGCGDINLYAVFAEAARSFLNDHGRAGCVLQSGIATDDTTKLYFQDVVKTGTLVSLFDFENKGIFFPQVHNSTKFCLFTAGHGARPATDPARFVFFAHDAKELKDPNRMFTLSLDEIELLNPNTRTCPIFRTQKDAELTKAIYRRVPILAQESPQPGPSGNPWHIRLATMFHMSNHSDLFHTREDLEDDGWWLASNVFRKADARRCLPLYEGRLGHQFHHRFATQPLGRLREISNNELSAPTTLVEPQYWVDREAVERRLSRWSAECRTALLGFRRVARNTDERTCIAAIIPYGAASYGWILSLGPDAADLLLLCGMYNSYVFDYCLRGKLSQASVPQGTFMQCPAIEPSVFTADCPWDRTRGLDEWIGQSVLELTYTAWDLQAFARDCGWHGPPFRWDESRRFLLRAELDAAFFHLYLPSTSDGGWQPARRAHGARKDEEDAELTVLQRHCPTPRDAVEYIMDTFRIVKHKDEQNCGEYRTKRAILEGYDAMQRAMSRGTRYQSQLDPLPADPHCCHPPAGERA